MPIAHGYLTLSLFIPLFTGLLDVQGVSTKVNYGLNKVRFPAPVPVGSRIRLVARLAAVDEVAGGMQITGDGTVEIEGGTSRLPYCKPVTLLRLSRPSSLVLARAADTGRRPAGGPIPAVLDDLLLVADDAVLVQEASIIAGMRMFLDHAGLVVEPSAALGIAAILDDRDRFPADTS